LHRRSGRGSGAFCGVALAPHACGLRASRALRRGGSAAGRAAPRSVGRLDRHSEAAGARARAGARRAAAAAPAHAGAVSIVAIVVRARAARPAGAQAGTQRGQESQKFVADVKV
jgi:hypothetical protein